MCKEQVYIKVLTGASEGFWFYTPSSKVGTEEFHLLKEEWKLYHSGLGAYFKMLVGRWFEALSLTFLQHRRRQS